MWQASFLCLLFVEGILTVDYFLCILNISERISDKIWFVYVIVDKS